MVEDTYLYISATVLSPENRKDFLQKCSLKLYYVSYIKFFF
jgi:hypothetical protein